MAVGRPGGDKNGSGEVVAWTRGGEAQKKSGQNQNTKNRPTPPGGESDGGMSERAHSLRPRPGSRTGPDGTGGGWGPGKL